MSLLQTGFLFLQEHLFQSTSCVVEGLLYGTRSAVVEGSQFPNRLSLHVVAKEQFFVMRTKPRQARPYTLLHLPSQQTGLRQINGGPTHSPVSSGPDISRGAGSDFSCEGSP